MLVEQSDECAIICSQLTLVVVRQWCSVHNTWTRLGGIVILPSLTPRPCTSRASRTTRTNDLETTLSRYSNRARRDLASHSYRTLHIRRSVPKSGPGGG